MEVLVKVAERHDSPGDAAAMRQRIEDLDYSGAASVFKSAKRIPEGEKWQSISGPFLREPGDGEIEKLVDLISLPFVAAVTTNYDRALHHAFSHYYRRHPSSVEITDDTLRGASTRNDFFIARLHGNSENPSSMVLSDEDFVRVEDNEAYLDFLLHVLTRRSCLFVGFSFLDPAVQKVLGVLERKVGPHFPSLHTALLPEGESTELRQALAKYNIRVLGYSGAKSHRALWQVLGWLRVEHLQQSFEPPHPGTTQVSTIHRFLAFAYTQGRLRRSRVPVLQQVVEGVVTSILSGADNQALSLNELLSEFRQALALDEAEASPQLEEALIRLEGSQQVKQDDGAVALLVPISSDVPEMLSMLAVAVSSSDLPPPTVPPRVLVQSSLAAGVRTPECREIQERMIRPDRLWGWWPIAQ